VELHGGTIGCSSTLGQGSEFFFDVPCEVVPGGVVAFGHGQASPVAAAHTVATPGYASCSELSIIGLTAPSGVPAASVTERAANSSLSAPKLTSITVTMPTASTAPSFAPMPASTVLPKIVPPVALQPRFSNFAYASGNSAGSRFIEVLPQSGRGEDVQSLNDAKVSANANATSPVPPITKDEFTARDTHHGGILPDDSSPQRNQGRNDDGSSFATIAKTKSKRATEHVGVTSHDLDPDSKLPDGDSEKGRRSPIWLSPERRARIQSSEISVAPSTQSSFPKGAEAKLSCVAEEYTQHRNRQASTFSSLQMQLQTLALPRRPRSAPTAGSAATVDSSSKHGLNQIDSAPMTSTELLTKPMVLAITPNRRSMSVGNSAVVESGASNATDAASTIRAALDLATVPQLRRSFRVLLAEDHAPTAKLMSMTLRKLGCEVTVAENGVMAINAFKSTARLDGSGSASTSDAPLVISSTAEMQPFQLILMDGNMPFVGESLQRLHTCFCSAPI